jgi:regulator of protease activity HflC (stomatin/prohibitin superfamily)
MDIPSLAEIALSLLGGGGTLFNSYKLVKEGEKGIKLRFGRAVKSRSGPNSGNPKEYEPGLTLLIPFVDSMYTRHIRVQTIELQGQTITIEKGLSYIVDAVVRFKVKNIYNALFVVDNLDAVMNNVSMGVLRDVLAPSKTPQEMNHTEEMSKKLTEALKVHQSEWGVEIEAFTVISCVPTVESQQIVTAAAGAKMRMEALDEALGKGKAFEHPTLAAALVGVPVSVALSHERVRFSSKATQHAVDASAED